MVSHRKVVVPGLIALAVIVAGMAALGVNVLRNAHTGVHAAAASLPYNATANGPYKVQRNTIVGADGKQYIIRGIGRDGMEYNCSGEGPLDKQSLSYMGSGTNTATETYWGTNTVRLSLSEGFWLNGAPGYPCTSTQYQTLLKQTVDNLTALKLNVILDLHWVNADGQSAQGGGPWSSPDADSVTFWSQVSSVYKGYSNVLFGLYNEPHSASWQCWLNGCKSTNETGYSGDCFCSKTVSYQTVGMQTLVNTVRATGATNLVLVGGVNWGYDLSQLNNGYALSGSNIVYDTHPYPYSGKMPTDWDTSFGNLSSKYAMISTENGEYDCASSYVSQLYDYLDAHQIGWVAWAWYAQPSASHSNVCGYPQLVYDYLGTPTAVTGQYIYQRLHSYAPVPAATPAPTPTSLPTPTPTSTPLPTPAPTHTPSPTPTPASTPTPAPTATPLPTPPPTPVSTPILNGYNNTGVSNDSTTNTSNYDGENYSYSAQALLADGIKPGGTINSQGFAFTWPDVNSGTSNNYRASGQTITVTPVYHAHVLALLGSATNGAAGGIGTITYTDGSRQNFILNFTDWTWTTHFFDNSVVATMPYRNASYGQEYLKTYLLSTSVMLRPGKTVQSVTLPSVVRGGSLHVFAIATK